MTRLRLTPTGQAWAALLLLQAVCTARFLTRLGFYLDDWYFLEVFSGPGGVLGLAAGRFKDFASRPTLSLFFSSLVAAGGREPAVYQTILAVLAAAEALLLFGLFRRMSLPRGTAFVAAAASLLYPGRSGNRVWFSNAPQNAALILAAVSLTLHLDWLRTRRAWRLAVGQALALLGGLTYESLLFMPLMAALPRAAGGRVRRTFVDFSPYLVTAVAVLAWKALGVPAFGTADPKSVSASFGWAATVYREAAYCLFVWPFTMAVRVLPSAGRESELFDWALFAGAAAAALLGLRRAPGTAGPRGPVLWAGAGAFLAAYAPYAVSGGYQPMPLGVMSRVNGAGAWAFGLFVAAALSALPWRRSATAVLVPALLVVNMGVSWRWADSWIRQQDILARAARRSAQFPPEARVLLADAPMAVGGVVVFAESWDFPPALRLALGRPDLGGAVLNPPTPEALEAFLRSAPERPRCVFSYARDAVECRPADGPAPAARGG